MSFWSHARLSRHLEEIIDIRCDNPLDCNAVVLRIGPEIYITPHLHVKDPQANTKVRLIDREPFTVPAGQFAFLLTEEFLRIPNEAMGFISIRTSVKFRGLVNISGFHVEPGYTGRLIFAVFNAGPTSIHLQRGDPIFRLWLANLDTEAGKKDVRNSGPNNEVPAEMREIPTKFIQHIPGEIHSLQSLSDRIRQIDENYKQVVAKFTIILTLVTTITAALLLQFTR